MQAAQEVVQQAAPSVEAATQAAQAAANQGAAQGVVFVWWLVLALGLGIFFLIEFARVLPLKKETITSKPFSCDACMTGWAAILAGAFLYWLVGKDLAPALILTHVPAAAGLCYLLLGLRRYWAPLPPQ